MDIGSFTKLVGGLTEQDISSDESHVSLRCEENDISFDEIKRFILFESKKLVRLVEDRPHVFKLYYKLSRTQELKIVIDLFTYRKINVRTVKRLLQKYRIGTISKQRF